MLTLRPIWIMTLLLVSAACNGAEIYGVVRPTGKALRMDLVGKPASGKDAGFSGDVKVDTKTGKFRCSSVPKGTWRLCIWPDEMRYLAMETYDLKVSANTKLNLGTVVLKPSAWICGTVDPPGGTTLLWLHSVDANGVQTGDDPYISDKMNDQGRFEIDNVPPGKYVLVVQRPDCADQRVKLKIARTGEHSVGTIQLAPLSKIAGTIDLKSMREGDRGELRLIAIRLDERPPHNYRQGYQSLGVHPRGAIRATLQIREVPPGRYDLAVQGPGNLVIGDSSLPALSDAQSAADAALRTLVSDLGDALLKHDVKAIRAGTSAGCRFHIFDASATGNVSDPLQAFADPGFTYGRRRFAFSRVGSDRAVIYTRVEMMIKKQSSYDELWPSEIPMELVEIWRFARVGSEWKLNEYIQDGTLSDWLNWMRLGSAYTLPESELLKLKSLPEANFIVTDDARLTNVVINKGGQSSVGHDWTLETPKRQ